MIDAAIDYMKGRDLPQIVIGKFTAHEARIFCLRGRLGAPFAGVGPGRDESLARSRLDRQRSGAVGRDPSSGLAAGHGRLFPTTPASFASASHALCWVHAERLVHKLVPANDKQRNAVEIAKRMIWWFYRALKEYKLAPNLEQAQILRARFDRIFKRARTGYATLDGLLKRLFRTRTNSCACSSGRKSRSTPTPRKTTSAPSSRNEKYPAEPSAKKAATPATSCSVWPKPA